VLTDIPLPEEVFLRLQVQHFQLGYQTVQLFHRKIGEKRDLGKEVD
jgi:hypothetical protein